MRRAAGALLTLVVTVGLVALLPATPVAACSCVMPRPVEEATLDEYDVALTGEVTRNEDVDGQRRELVVTVDEVFKGEAATELLVVTHAQSSACGTDPPVGTDVLFLMTWGPEIPIEDFATDDELVVMSCGGARDATEADALGTGRPPEQVDVSDDDLGSSTSAVAVVGLAVLVLGVLVAIGGGVALTSRRLRRRAASEGEP